MSNSIREINEHVMRFMGYDGTRFKRRRKKESDRNRRYRVSINQRYLRRGNIISPIAYRMRANECDITFCDIPHSKSFIWDELINLVARAFARKRGTTEKRERSTAFYARCCGESWRNNFIKLRNWNCFERSPRALPPHRSFHPQDPARRRSRTRKINTSH